MGYKNFGGENKYMPKLSVIMPIYNVATYLRECLDSILSQSFIDYELILVDDGSMDDSGAICDEYASNEKRVSVIHKDNEGLVRARKTGLLMASGDYVICIDGDDWIEAGAFEYLAGLMDSENVDLVLTARFKDTGASSRKIEQAFSEGRYDRSRIEKEILPHMIVNDAFFRWGISPNMWDRIFKRKKLLKCQMDVDDLLTMGEDAACTYPYILDCDSLYITHKAFYHYRQTTTSMTSTSSDVETERKRFRTLYSSVLGLIRKRAIRRDSKTISESEAFDDTSRYVLDGNVIDDLCRQWRDYILFLSVPRADLLLDGFDDLDYLFPFPDVHKGDRIVIYGAGEYGQRLYRYCERSGFCKVVALVDRNYEELKKQGIPASSPSVISELEFDEIVLAISFAENRYSIMKDLRMKYPDKCIYEIDENLIKSENSLEAFGMKSF